MTNPVENKIIHAADSVEPSAEFSQALWNQIRTTPRHESAPKRVSRFVWIPALTVLGILVVMVFVAPQTVLAAFKSLLAYIPGIGFVQKDETTLYLEKPVIVEKEGYTFSLDQVVADKDKVSISYHMVSPTANFYHCAYNGNYLIWTNGKSNNPIGGGGVSTPDGGFSAQIDYFPLPEGESQASISVSADPGEPGCAAPSEWIVPFTLGKVAPDVEILPVIENATTVTATSLQSKSEDSPIRLIVDTMQELPDGYLLSGHIDYDKEYWLDVGIKTNTLVAVDAKGKSISIEQGDASYKHNSFALKIVGKDFTAPLSIHVKDLYVQLYDEKSSSFSFDAGNNPQIDQSWKINQEMVFAGKKYSVQEIKVINGDYDFNPKTVEIAYGISMKLPEGFGVLMDCVGQDGIHSIGNVAKPVIDGEYTAEVDYKDGIPNGKVTCKALNASDMESGDWQFDWQPPVSTPSVSTSPSSTDSSVQFFIDKYVELNDGYLLTGHIEKQAKSWRSVSIDMTTLSAHDANGKNITLEPTNESLNDNEFALKVVGKSFTAPLNIQVQKLLVMASEEEAPSFSFDAGIDPQINQSWDINKEIEIAGKKILIKGVKVIEDTTKTNYPASVMGFDISASSSSDINVSFDCSGKENSSSSWNQSLPGNGNEFSVENYYPDGIPNGDVTCKIWSAFFQASGDWQFTWQPESAAK